MKTQAIDKGIESILKLSLQERIYVYQLIWQSILKEIETETTLLTSEQKKEIDRRLERIENGEVELFSWQELRKEIEIGL